MSSAIMRFDKAHTKTEISHKIAHNTRTKEVRNADKDREHLNKTFNYYADIHARIKELEKQHKKVAGKKAQKNAVRVLEAIITSDSKYFKNHSAEEYFKQSEDWLKSIFGEENILQVCYHFDEKTPHAHILLTPIRDSKFNCKSYINGKFSLRGLQNSFHNSVKHLGLERGELVEFTKAKHQSALEFSNDVDKKKQYLDELTPKEIESYAIKGIQAQEEIQELKEHIEVIEEENQDLKHKKDAYEDFLIDRLKTKNPSQEAIQQALNSVIWEYEKKQKEKIFDDIPTVEELGMNN